MKWHVAEPDERGFREVRRSVSGSDHQLGRIEEVEGLVIAQTLDGKSSDFESIKEALRWLNAQVPHAVEPVPAKESDEFYARRDDPDTSHISALLIESEVSRLEGKVLSVIRSATKDGIIADEIAAALPEHRRHTVVPRLAKLQKKGLIQVVGKRLSESTGRLQQIYQAVPEEEIEEARQKDFEETRKRVYRHVASLLAKPHYREAMKIALHKEDV